MFWPYNQHDRATPRSLMEAAGRRRPSASVKAR